MDGKQSLTFEESPPDVGRENVRMAQNLSIKETVIQYITFQVNLLRLVDSKITIGKSCI